MKTPPPSLADVLPTQQVTAATSPVARGRDLPDDEWSALVHRLFREAHANYSAHLKWLNSRKRGKDST